MASILFPGGNTATSEKTNSKIRFSSDLSAGEKKSIENRKAKVSACLTSLGMNVDQNKIPQIAVILSGGSMTAAIGSLGTLLELKNQNLLDAVTFISGCSGSTWLMTSLYDKGDWTKNLDSIDKELRAQWASLNFDATKGIQKLIAAAEQDNYSLTHFWAYIVVNFTVSELNEKVISSQRAFCESGDVPYPYYSSADKQQEDTKGKNNYGTWFQNTPHEAGYPLIGAFLNSEYFDSKYSNSQLVKKEPELDLCYLQGIWSSALAAPEQALKLVIDKIVEFIVQPYAPKSKPSTGLLSGLPVLGNLNLITSILSDLEKILKEGAEGSKVLLEQLLTVLSVVRDTVTYQLVKWMNDRWDTNDLEEKLNLFSILNLLQLVELAGLVIPVAKVLIKTVLCLVGWIWGTTDNFLYKSGASVPSDLTDKEFQFLIDAGFANSSPYPLILRKEQQVKLILSFEFFPMLDPFLGIKQASDYCKANNIPFPKVEIDPADQFNPDGCYIFEDENTPTVFHFPIFNRVTSEGTVQQRTAQYNIANLKYSIKDIDKLANIALMNLRNYIEKIKDKVQQLLSDLSD
ncbi:cytosolic phospholipase A2 gamma [Microcaecilia unicolor]|uniref:Cytosolic phospholipase A2 gamma-like n=1 Tax=Microcaecilia unicolor TaxID=1415580 RepID=A0A6P7WYB6_9AMPH|nr:cytosolic phospholipase A2 gamma-like [Microcaecilia unicolor]